MTTYYWDPISGNDANDGLSFANRKLNLASFTPSAGDTIRCIASPDPVDTTLTGTFTNGSESVTLSSTVATTVYLDGAWTGSANVTATTSTTVHRVGTSCANLAIAAAFVTGRIAYFPTGTLDLSNREQLNLWIRTSAAVAAGVLAIDLCSDALGLVPVNSFNVPQLFNGSWIPLVFDNAGALGSSIQSIAVRAISDPGAITLNISGAFASNASSSATSLTLNHLVGKNTVGDPYWRCMRFVNGNVITFDPHVNSLPTLAPGYIGTTETVAFYKRLPLKIGPTSNSDSTVIHSESASGTVESRILISGGWNRTDMSTQTGRTWLDHTNGRSESISATGSYVDFEKFDFARVAKGYHLDGLGIRILGDSYETCSGLTVTAGSAGTGHVNGTGNWRFGSVTGTLFSVHSAAPTKFEGAIDLDIYGLSQIGTVTAGEIGRTTTDASSYLRIRNLNIQMPLTLTGSNARGFQFTSGSEIEIDNATVNITTSRAAFFGNRQFGRIRFNKLHITSASTIFEGGSLITINDFTRTTLTSGVWNSAAINRAGKIKLVTNTSVSLGAGVVYEEPIYVGKRLHLYPQGGGAGTDNSVTRSGSGESWYIQPMQQSSFTGSDNAVALDYQEPFRVYVEANRTLTFKAWVMRTHPTEVDCRLRIQGGRLDGIANDVTSGASASANVWEQISISATPTESGVVEIYFEAWMVTAAAVDVTVAKRAYIDDIDWQVV